MNCMTKVNWQDHFTSAKQEAANLYSKDSTNVSLLMFCLRSKLIPAAEYLEWAKENFQIPVLSEKFFQSHKPQAELYKKWQNIHKWSNECLPIAEWDGVLIIACLEIPEDYGNVNPTTFVLTSHEFLDQTWALYNKSEKSPAATGNAFADMTALAATVIDKPGDEENLFGNNGELILKDDSSSEEEGSTGAQDEQSSGEKPEDMEVSASEEASGMPEGLVGDSPAPKMEALSNFAKPEPVALQPMSAEISRELNAKIEAAAVEDVPVTVELPKKGPRTSVPLMANIMEKEKVGSVAALDDMEKIDDHEVEFPNKKQITPIASVSTGEFPSVPVKPTMNPADSAAYFLEKMRKQAQNQFDSDVISSFQELKTFFKKSMLLAIGEKDTLVKPILWDSGFDVKTPAAPEFNLKTPSIFKVVSGTQKPYHGYVVPNDLNESFFESWNHGQIPDHVTIVPLMDGDILIGMIMGFGEKSTYNKSVLQFTENVAKGLSTKLLKGPTAKVA